MKVSALGDLEKHRDEILWWEICALLHDVGKLSDEFLFYRQNWHLMKDGYGKDPHEHWFDVEDLLEPAGKFKDLRAFFHGSLAEVTAPGMSGTISIAHAAHEHTKADIDDLVNLLRLADRADSAYDRNNPLIGCEQTIHEDPDRRPEVYRSNTFGYEGPDTRVYRGKMSTLDGIDKPPKRVRDGILTRARRELYQELLGLIQPEGVPRAMGPELYRKLRSAIRKHFAPAMADTTRPDNDTDLWEHTYSVASITKALHVQRLLGLGTPTEKAVFRIWGFGFDALRYLSFAHKIGDVLGRRAVLKTIFDQAEKLFEYEIPFGNSIYRDDNFVFFLAPPGSQQYDEELQRRLRELSVEASAGELVPSFAASGDVHALTRIVEQMQVLRKRTGTPVAGGAAGLHRAFEESWSEVKTPVSVCPVCRVRPIRGEDTAAGKVCWKCLDRRQGHTKESLTLNLGAVETPFLEEIVDSNGRAALIVAKLGIRDWLDGVLVGTNLVTQTNAAARTKLALENIRDHPLGASKGNEQLAWLEARENTYRRMLDEVGDLLRGSNPEALLLYGRGIVDCREKLSERIEEWQEVLSDAGAEHPFLKGRQDDVLLLNLLCGKTPTPSTVLDVWRTAEDFFAGIAQKRFGFGQEQGEAVLKEVPSLISEHEELDMGPRPRGWVEVDKIPEGFHPAKNETFAAEIGSFRCEAVYEGNANRFWVLWPEAEKAWANAKTDREKYERHRRDWEGQDLVLRRDVTARDFPLRSEPLFSN